MNQREFTKKTISAFRLLSLPAEMNKPPDNSGCRWATGGCKVPGIERPAYLTRATLAGRQLHLHPDSAIPDSELTSGRMADYSGHSGRSLGGNVDSKTDAK